MNEMYAKLLNVATRYVGTDDARDVVHDAFVRWLSRAGDVVNLNAYLTTIVRRVAIDKLRKRKLQPLLTDMPQPTTPTINEFRQHLSETLSDDDLKILNLYLAGHPYRDMVAETGLSESTVRRRLNAIREQIRETWR